MSRPGQAVVTVRFFVGEDRERSLVKVWNKVMSNQDAVPSGVTSWIVKPIEIDDVPIVLFTLSSPNPQVRRTGAATHRRRGARQARRGCRTPARAGWWVASAGA